MGTIYYVCKDCEEHNPEGACYPRKMVRVAKDGEWVCENCFEDAPAWTYVEKPQGDDPDHPVWNEMPEVPEHVPAR